MNHVWSSLRHAAVVAVALLVQAHGGGDLVTIGAAAGTWVGTRVARWIGQAMAPAGMP